MLAYFYDAFQINTDSIKHFSFVSFSNFKIMPVGFHCQFGFYMLIPIITTTNDLLD